TAAAPVTTTIHTPRANIGFSCHRAPPAMYRTPTSRQDVEFQAIAITSGEAPAFTMPVLTRYTATKPRNHDHPNMAPLVALGPRMPEERRSTCTTVPIAAATSAAPKTAKASGA